MSEYADSEAAKKWLKEHNIKVDEDGFPEGAPGPDAIAVCSRCGQLCEHPTEFFGQMFGREVRGVTCIPCSKIRFTDIRKYWDEGWEALKNEEKETTEGS